MPKYFLDVLSFYNKVSTQWIVGFSGIVGLNYQSVKDMAEIFEFELTPFNMSVIQEIEGYVLDQDAKKRDKDRETF